MWRVMFGDLGGGKFGVKVSKPGFDVTTTPRGNLLFDSSAIAFQKVANGETLLASGSLPGTFSQSIPLPAEYSTYSNLQVWANLIHINANSDGTSADETASNGSDLTFGVSSGVLYITLVTNIDTRFASQQLRSNWAVFNAQVTT